MKTEGFQTNSRLQNIFITNAHLHATINVCPLQHTTYIIFNFRKTLSTQLHFSWRVRELEETIVELEDQTRQRSDTVLGRLQGKVEEYQQVAHQTIYTYNHTHTTTSIISQTRTH